MYYPIFNPRTDIDACVRSETLQDFAKVEVHGARARLKSALEHLRASTSRRSKAVSKYEQQRREPQLAARAWSFIDPKGQESDGFSLVELLPLAKSVPTLRINNSLQELSLRLVDALNLQKGFLRAVGERKAAEAAEEEAEERVKEAKAKVRLGVGVLTVLGLLIRSGGNPRAMSCVGEDGLVRAGWQGGVVGRRRRGSATQFVFFF